jgi:hypothetical protein
MAGSPKVQEAPWGSVAIQLNADGEKGLVKSIT